jgi:hypothetical protein
METPHEKWVSSREVGLLGPAGSRQALGRALVGLPGREADCPGPAAWGVAVGYEVARALGAPHKFVISGHGRVRHNDIHTSRRMTTEWFED